MRLSHATINDDNINNNYFYHMAKSVFHNVIGQFAVRNYLLYGPKSQKQMLISQL